MDIKKEKIHLTSKLKIGMTLVIFLFSLSLSSFFFPPLTQKINLARSFEPPSWSHPFGLDENGIDILIQILHGSRISFTVALSVVFISLVIGLILGTVSGIFTRHLDSLIMRFVDMVHAFPHFLLAMALMAVLGASIINLILVMSLTTWATYARLIRGEILYLKKKDFVLSVESLGASLKRKVFFHIWPHLIPILSVQITLTMAGVILTESGLSFLGIGIPPEIPTWGSLLREGRQALIEAPHLSFFPGSFLFLLILGFHLLGDGLREFLSPHKKRRS